MQSMGDASVVGDPGDNTPLPDENSDGSVMPPGDGGMNVGTSSRVTASPELNLRDAPGTTAKIIGTMPCGAEVQVIGGPSTQPVAGWWNVTYQSLTGWASGKYLVGSAQFDPAVCGPTTPPTGSTLLDGIFTRAKEGVGYSYYWGHGSWRSDGTQPGMCGGLCPNCTHSGQYGADCSGFVAKCWQVPSPSPIETDLHPYSTYNFYNQTTHWTKIPRSTLKPGDALVYNANGEGHIVLVESGDPFGNLWLYEARGCATGVVHNLRTVSSTYIAIRREGL